MRPLLLVLFLVVMVAVSRPYGAGQDRLPSATWGGQHLVMSMDDGIHLEFDCAHATLAEAPKLDKDGSFDVVGHYKQEHGGPVRKDEDETGNPARFQGSLKGDTLTLTIVLDDKTKLGPYTLEKGKPGRIFKCM